jgi:hypothetical protein
MSLEHSPARQTGRGAFTIAEYCEHERISRAKLYQEWAEGRGPRCYYRGSKRLISAEAAAEYRHELEREAASQADKPPEDA